MRWVRAIPAIGQGLFYLELIVGTAWRVQLPPYQEPKFQPDIIYDLPYTPPPKTDKDCWIECWGQEITQMIESVHLPTIKQLASEYDNKLKVDDYRFHGSVKIQHRDGSELHFQRAFAMTRDDWVLVFAEHHGVHVYDADDLVGISLHHPYGLEQSLLEKMP